MKKIYLGVLSLLMMAVGNVNGQTTFNYTGSMQTYVVPATGTYLLECWGAQGGSVTTLYPVIGGEGGYAAGEMMLTAGQTLNIYVGGKGEDRLGDHPYGSCTVVPGGWNGGGENASAGNGTPGGGASDIRLGGTALTDRIIVAGGGGGCGWTFSQGGAGGGLVGQDGTGMNYTGTGSGGGTQSAGGAQGISGSMCTISAGSLGLGGSGSGWSAGGGGGGGGYYGGGGGGYGDGGGGGSSYIDLLTNGTTTQGGRVGDGQIIITQLCSPTMITADQVSLSDVISICEVISLTAPTATNDCGATVSGTPDVSLPITTIGNTLVTWTFDDGSGNTTTQTQNVILTGLNTTITAAGSTIEVAELVAAYQWLDCDNGYAPIAGAVNQFYTATATGNYAVEVTKNGCVDTSACFMVDLTALGELSTSVLNIYPNPSNTGSFEISYDGVITDVKIFDLMGREISVKVDLEAKSVNTTGLSEGQYVVKIAAEDKVATRSLVVTK